MASDLQKLWTNIVGDAAFASAVKKGSRGAIRDKLCSVQFSLRPKDAVAVATWLDRNKVGDSAISIATREITLQHLLSVNVAFQHKPAFEDFFDAMASAGAMEAASKTLSATVGHSQAVAGLRRIASKPLFTAPKGASRAHSLAAMEASRICTQAASALRHL